MTERHLIGRLISRVIRQSQELAKVREERDMLARRLAELAHKHYGVTYREAA